MDEAADKKRLSKPVFGISWLLMTVLFMALAAAVFGNEFKYLMYFPLLVGIYVGYVMSLMLQALVCRSVSGLQAFGVFVLWLVIAAVIYLLIAIKVDELDGFNPVLMFSSLLFAFAGMHLVKTRIDDLMAWIRR